MSDKTTKQLLELINLQITENARKQFDFSCEMSNFVNEQRDFNNKQVVFNTEIKGYLESNTKTNQKGIIEQQEINTKDINNLKNQTKIVVGISTALGFLSSFFYNLYNKT